MHSLPPPFLAPRPSKNSNICIQHGSHTFFWKSYSAHSQGEAKYKMYCSHLSAFLSSLFNLFGHLHRGAQPFFITVILKDILLEKLATASTNSPSLWPGSLYCLLPFAILCNGEYDNILISCSKRNKMKQNKNDGVVSTSKKVANFSPLPQEDKSFHKNWIVWPYKAFSLETKLVANKYCSSNLLCLHKEVVAHVILGRDEEEEEKAIVYKGFY